MDPLSVSGLAQPSVNLGGLLGMSSLSGNPTTMSGGTQGASQGSGMVGGMDLAQLLEMLNQQQGDQSAIGLGQPLGSAPVSIAQQQALGQGGIGGQGYLTAGGVGGGGGGGLQFGNNDADPLAIIQKVLGLAQKGVSLTGNSNTPLASPSSDMGTEFDPTGQTQAQGFQQYRAGEMQDYSGLNSLLNAARGPQLNEMNRLENFYTGLDSQNQEMNRLENLYSQPGMMQGPQGIPSETMNLSGDVGAASPFTFNPTLGNSLGVLGGLAGLAGGIQSQNPYGITGGSLATAGNAASMLGYPGVGSAIGALGGPLSLASGIQTGNPMSLASGALQTYQAAAQLASYFPELSQYLPSLGQLATEALQAVAPGLAETLGLGVSAGGGAAATAGATGAAEGGAAAGGTALGGATLGVAALPAAILGGVFMKKDADEMQSIINGMKETLNRRQQLPQDVNTTTQGIQATAALPADLSTLSTPDILQQLNLMGTAHGSAMNNIQALVNNPSSAPSRIPRMDTTGLRQLTAAEYNSIPLGIAALQDELARRGVPVEQYWQPLSVNDILGLVGNAPVTPEQLASIGPGNMLPSLQALRLGQPLANLPPALPGVGQARLGALQAMAPDQAMYTPRFEQIAPYFFTPQQQQQFTDVYQQYPGLQQAWEGAQQGTSSVGPAPQTPLSLWQQMLGTYTVPQTPAGMYGTPQAQSPTAAAPVMAPTGLPVPQTPQQALTLQMLLSRTPGFSAQGNVEDPYLPLLFAQYGLA